MRIDLTDRNLWKSTHVIGAGGTLLSKLTDNGHVASTGHVSPLDFECNVEKETRPFALKFYDNLFTSYIGLSENINKKTLNKIVKDIREVITSYPTPKFILVVCGTDAMEQIAREIDKKLGALIKERKIKVILTGGNRRLSRRDTDGWDNLKSAFIKGHSKDIIPGVYIEFHNRLIPAELTVKELFDGVEMNYISSSDRNYIDSLKRQKEISREIIDNLNKEIDQRTSGSRKGLGYPVNVIRSRQDRLRTKLTVQQPSLVLLTLYHSSTANTDPKKPIASVAKVIEDYRDRTVFFAITENRERVNLTPDAYETSNKLREAGLIPLGTMNQQVALAKLQMCAHMPKIQMIDTMTTNIVGELDEQSIDKKLIENQKGFYT